MKKLILVVLGCIVFGGIAAPKFIGDMAKDAYLQGFDNYPNSDASFSFEHKSFAQSWFSSQVVTVIKLATGTPKIDAMDWILTSDIQHGPVLFTDDGIQFGLAYINTKSNFAGLPEAAQSFMDEKIGHNGLTFTSLIDFKQLSHDSMHMKSISFEEGKLSGIFGGLDLVGITALDYSSVKGDAVFPSSQIIAPDFALDIADASAAYNYHKYEDMALGQGNILFPLIEVVAKNAIYSFENFSIAVSLSEDGGKLNLVEKFAIATIVAPVPLTALQYELEIKQVDPKALKLWGDFSKNLQQTTGSTTPSLAQEQLRELLTALLQDGLELNQLLHIDGMGGRLSIDWDASYTPLPNGTHLLDVQDQLLLLQAVDMNIMLEIDAAIIMATPFSAMVSPYIAQGLIVEKDEKLVAKVTLVGGVLSVNEQPLPVELILPLLNLGL